MKQFCYSIQNSDALEHELQEMRALIDTEHPSAVLAHVYTGYSQKAQIRPILETLNSTIPEALVVGATAAGEICHGSIMPQSFVVCFSVFESSSITVESFSISFGEEEHYGRIIQERIDATPNIRGAEVLVDSTKLSTADLFPLINKCSPQINLFGAVPYAHTLEEPMFVFTDKDLDDATLILITYAGSNLHIASDYVIGWKPMGIGMRVTKASGSLLNELDNQPAQVIYDKYLQIPNDEHFYDNAFEFPFLRYINDTYMMRHPHTCLPDGSIELRAPIEEGDIMYLSYGDIPTIVSEVMEAHGRMERFHPQGIIMHNCAARLAFWNVQIGRETKPFQQLANTSGFFTGGEILRVNGELVHFNTTCVVIGMREGEPESQQLLQTVDTLQQENVNTQQTSMVRRMAHFINIAMQELVDSNRQLDMLARTDELTSLANRREMGNAITNMHESGEPFSLVMADLDNFKKVNDTYGHDIGDVVLKDTAALIKECIAKVDGALAGRWGGEEFMVLLPGMDIDQATEIAEDLRVRMEALRLEVVDHLTISLGVADSKTYSDMRTIYHDVDQALYAAKKAGKNTVVRATSLRQDS